MRDIKTCVVGLGSMGKNHAHVLGDLAGAAFLALADPAESVRAAYRPIQGVKVYADHREMLDRERPEAAIVTVSSEIHCEVVDHLAAAACTSWSRSRCPSASTRPTA
jgi:predicted dehydrogenase